MTQLRKPDMPAILERTNIAATLSGFMLPVFEAGSNAIHGIGARFGKAKSARENGRIVFEFEKGSSRSDFVAKISDNGIGLDNANYGEFLTPFTGHKLRRNGKGFGRFIGFKVFNKVEYFSRSKDGEKSFLFDVYNQESELTDIGMAEASFESGCTVTYHGAKERYERVWSSFNERSALNALTSNFLTYLVDGTMPETEVVFDGNRTNLRAHFAETFEHEQTYEFEVQLSSGIYPFTCRVSRVTRGEPFRKHALLFYADERLVGRGRPIEEKLGKPFFQSSSGREYVVIASASSPFLDTNASTDRTYLVASEDDIKTIVDACCERILETESEQNDQIKFEQRQDVLSLFKSQPLLRFGLSGQTVEQYVLRKPNNWGRERFVADLAVQRLREEKRWEEYVRETVSDEELYEKRKDHLFNKVSETYRNALAEYVIHRKAVIEIADELRKFDATTRMHPEDEIHSLIFPRNADSQSKGYYQHNLWLLDERLAFASYVSSDRTFHGGRRKAGDKVMDINFYDELFVAGGAGTNSVMMVEFKRPGRDDYKFGASGSDPIKQVIDTVKRLRNEKRFVTTEGETIRVADNTSIMAYVVADLEPTLLDVAEEYDFQVSWDERHLFRHHDKYDVYVEVLGYDKLLEDAKMRNGPFFDVLFNETGNK